MRLTSRSRTRAHRSSTPTPRTIYQEQFAIVLDGIVQSAPSINATSSGGRAQISGGFSSASEVNQLVTVLNYGALPDSIEEVSFSKISPTLGLNFLQQSLLAGAIGIAAGLHLHAPDYRLPGVVACVALIFYALIVFALFRLIPVTLTLAGVAALRALGGHGGRRQHPDLRAHQGRAARGQDAAAGDRGRLQPRLELDLRLEHVEHHHGVDPVLLRFVDDPRLRAGADHRRARVDVHGDHGSRADAALGRPPALGAQGQPISASGEDEFTLAVRAAAVRARPASVFDIIGKRRWFYLFSLLITIPGLIFIVLTPLTGGQEGLKFSIDFTGGTVREVHFQNGTPQPRRRSRGHAGAGPARQPSRSRPRATSTSY